MPADTKDYLNVEKIEEGQFVNIPSKPEGKNAGFPFKRFTSMFVKAKPDNDEESDENTPSGDN